MGKTLVLISQSVEDLTFATQVALVARLTLKSARTAQEGAQIIAQEDVAAIFAEVSSQAAYQALETAIQETIGLFSDKINANAIHFLTTENIEHSEYLVQSPLFGHYVLKNYENAADAGAHYGRIVKATLAERAFGLKSLLSDQAKLQIVKLTRSDQKQPAVEAVKNYLLAAKFQNRMATVIANAVDELLMNAVYDAPVDDLGRPTLASTPRNTLLDLNGRQAVEMHVGYDGNFVAITAIDLYGSLDKAKLFKHISKIYTDEEYKVKTSVAGAGIGLATVFRSGASFFFVSESQTRTEVTVFFRRTDNYRTFRDQFRFISTQFYF